MKQNRKEYLPLRWCKEMLDQSEPIFGTRQINGSELRVLIDEGYSQEEQMSVIRKYPILSSLFLQAKYDMMAQALWKDTMRDMDSMSIQMIWMQNKQVYHFDKDFSNELIHTDNLTFTKNAFDFLPYKVFYVDLSDNRELCEQIAGEGFFVYPEKVPDGSMWKLHICRIDEKYFYTDVVNAPNEDTEIALSLFQETTRVEQLDFRAKSDTLDRRERTVNTRLFRSIVHQAMMYLASVEPDIRENPETKETYKKPASNAAPKNKYSEIQKWDVGVRFGTAFRKWEQQVHSRHASGASHGRTRPHTRRAHWHHFWYGKKGEERVLRPKWVAETLVNMDLSEESPATVHKVHHSQREER